MSEERDSYWIVEWRYPASLGKSASSWMPCAGTPCRYKEAADKHPQRSYYEYRISEFERAETAESTVARLEAENAAMRKELGR